MNPAIDKLEIEFDLLKDLKKVGIVSNQTSASTKFIPSTEMIYNAAKKTDNCKVTTVFGPQHGYRQTEQDNMKETPDDFYKFSDGHKVPLFSLYSDTREPQREQLENVDTLVIDLQDIGCRVYTYMLTLAACMRAAAKYNKKIVVFDRANPLGLGFQNHKNEWQLVEGNRLEKKWLSFVGWYDIPMRHGLSMGELGYYFKDHDNLKLDYQVIPVDLLNRKTKLSELKKLKWAMPSPNIPCWESAFFFPAFVSLEGTNVSEGRGSTIPFQLIGAPWLDVQKCISFLKEISSLYLYDSSQNNSLFMREHHFRPTFNKYMGEICNGIQFHVSVPENINLFALGMCFIHFCCHAHPKDFKWSAPGYEYNFKDLPINLILGKEQWYDHFENAKSQSNSENLKTLLETTKQDEFGFMKDLSRFLIYRE
ncbi:exo-beta-N-acetylmuramidase NamZ family protein [Fluviispira sanaruensis]|uniref:DUF1343 domain-containing protein n=1 Tax=Fluviispira sanaruensis TaxID=2493639 RepID=A0A4V0P2L0_FLUSA|nr:DUF1343 domain-containing protein [Fluviispira sanaruensis]BBH53597.1 DUF1343 domain-containing protein [Fluviispira sanaruensis]